MDAPPQRSLVKWVAAGQRRSNKEYGENEYGSRNRDAGDAITDAGTALQAALTALGCGGNTVGDLMKSAKQIGLVRGPDTPLADAVVAVVNWVAAQRNQ